MKAAVIMMFRDEADILEACFYHWHEKGIRNFYLCDNGSKDDSFAIAEKTMKAFRDDTYYHLEKEPATDWPGRRVINRLIGVAQQNGCDFFFPADADEFIFGDISNLGEWINGYWWASMKYLNVLPNGREYWQEPHRKAYGKFAPEWMVSMGNHLIEDVQESFSDDVIYYRHYSMRTYEQFRNKMINYMEAFTQTQFQDHPHAQDYHRWKQEGEQFFVDRWNALTT